MKVKVIGNCWVGNSHQKCRLIHKWQSSPLSSIEFCMWGVLMLSLFVSLFAWWVKRRENIYQFSLSIKIFPNNYCNYCSMHMTDLKHCARTKVHLQSPLLMRDPSEELERQHTIGAKKFNLSIRFQRCYEES